MVNETYKCPLCDLAEPVVRFGFNRCGTQRLRCKACGKTWTPKARSRALTAEKEALIAAALQERLSQRAIARTFGCPLGGLRAPKCERSSKKVTSRALEFPKHDLAGDPGRCFGNRRVGDPLSLQAALSLFVACDLAADTTGHRLHHWRPQHPKPHPPVVFACGFRLWFSLPAPYRRKLVYSDFYQAYAEWFASWQHRPSDKGSGKTSIIEGLNNKWRNRVSGLVRKTVCVRYLDDLQRRLWLIIQAHNQLRLKQIERMLNLSTL